MPFIAPIQPLRGSDLVEVSQNGIVTKVTLMQLGLYVKASLPATLPMALTESFTVNQGIQNFSYTLPLILT